MLSTEFAGIERMTSRQSPRWHRLRQLTPRPAIFVKTPVVKHPWVIGWAFGLLWGFAESCGAGHYRRGRMTH